MWTVIRLYYLANPLILSLANGTPLWVSLIRWVYRLFADSHPRYVRMSTTQNGEIYRK